MSNRFTSKWLVCILLVGTLASCVDPKDFDFDKMASTSWNPQVGIPLIKADMGVKDIMANQDTNAVTSGPGGLVILVYPGQTIDVSADDIFEFPPSYSAPTPPSTPAAPGATVNLDLPFGQINNVDISAVSFSGGFLNASFFTGGSGSVDLEFPTIQNGGGGTLSVRVPFNSQSSQIALNGYTLRLNSLGELPVILRFSSNASGNAPLTISITDATTERVEGDFGSTPIQLPLDSIKLHVFRNLTAEGELYLNDTKLNVEISNGFGVPMEVDISSMEGYNPVTGTTNPMFNTGQGKFQIGRGSLQTPFEATAELNNTNSNISKVILPTPVYLRHQSQININPAGPANPDNVLESGSELKVATKLELPLDGRIADLYMADTVLLGLNDQFTIVQDLNVKTKVENGFPFDISIRMKVLDENMNPVLTASGKELFLAGNETSDSPLFVSGVIQPGTGRIDQETLNPVITDYELDAEETAAILKGKYVQVLARFNSADGGSKDVQVFDNYRLKVQVGVKITGNIQF